MRKIWFGIVFAMACGCSDQNIYVARQLVQPDPGGGEPSVVTIADCQSYGFIEMERACVVDADGKTYGLAGGGLNAVSAAPPYGVYFLFTDDAVPLAEDITTTGPDASVQAFAAPYDVQGSPCCSEGSPANRIAARASLTSEGGLLVTVHDALPVGTQIAVILGYGQLFHGRVHPADGGTCSLPFDLCTMANARGWAARFYVGQGPTTTTGDGTTPQGKGIVSQ